MQKENNPIEKLNIEQWMKKNDEWIIKHPILSKYRDIYSWCYRNSNPVGWYREVKYFIQRGARGYSDRDLWSVSDFFRGTILKGLKEFKRKYRDGYPACFANKHNDEKQATEKWENVLQDMIDGLDYITTDHVDTELWADYFEKKIITREQYLKESEKLYKEAEQKAGLFIKYIQAIWS